jgi:hypothetical protein
MKPITQVAGILFVAFIGIALMAILLSQPIERQASAQGTVFGATGTIAAAGVGVSNLVAKASPGNLLNAYAVSSAAAWVFVINATSLPANATLTVGTASGNLQDCFELLKANTDYQGTITYNPGPWENFNTGITIGVSSTACPVLTAATTSVHLHASVQ